MVSRDHWKSSTRTSESRTLSPESQTANRNVISEPGSTGTRVRSQPVKFVRTGVRTRPQTVRHGAPSTTHRNVFLVRCATTRRTPGPLNQTDSRDEPTGQAVLGSLDTWLRKVVWGAQNGELTKPKKLAYDSQLVP
jgi:hypothetical protein